MNLGFLYLNNKRNKITSSDVNTDSAFSFVRSFQSVHQNRLFQNPKSSFVLFCSNWMCLCRVSVLTTVTHCCTAVCCAATQHPLRVTNRVTKAFEIPAREDVPLKSKT